MYCTKHLSVYYLSIEIISPSFRLYQHHVPCQLSLSLSVSLSVNTYMHLYPSYPHSLPKLYISTPAYSLSHSHFSLCLYLSYLSCSLLFVSHFLSLCFSLSLSLSLNTHMHLYPSYPHSLHKLYLSNFLAFLSVFISPISVFLSSLSLFFFLSLSLSICPSLTHTHYTLQLILAPARFTV